MTNEELQELRTRVNATLKSPSLLASMVPDLSNKVINGVSSGSIMLNSQMSGNPFVGYAWGRIAEIYGPESCLDADTYIKYEVRSSDGKRQNHRGGTIRRLYERFHAIKRKGKGFYQRKSTVDSEFFVTSVNAENKIFINPVADVVFTGLKYCYHVRTVGGNEIVCTEDHKFFDGKEYKRLGDISVGDVVYVHRGVRGKKEHKRFKYAEVFVKYHPNGSRKIVTANDRQGNKKYSYVRYRVKKSHLLVEAEKNKLSYDKYVQYLNTLGQYEIDSFWTVPESKCVHHIDGDHRNDVLSNLKLMDGSDHNRIHAKETHNDLRFVAIDDMVESIVPIGYRETYDIKCFYPYNNYVANGFVVHNSGKTTLALHAIKEVQLIERLTGVDLPVLFIDMEHSLDPYYADALGIDMDRLTISQPGCAEVALNATEEAFKAGFKLVVVDSVAALTPKAEVEGEMGESHVGLQARLMSQACRKLTPLVKKNNGLLLFINQIRMKIGVMFGNPETRPGGKALDYYATYILEIRTPRSGKKTGNSLMGYEGSDIAESVELATVANVTLKKNKVFPPFRKASFVIEYGVGIDRVKDLITFLEYTGAFTTPSKKDRDASDESSDSKKSTPSLLLPKRKKRYTSQGLLKLLKADPEAVTEVYDIIEKREVNRDNHS